jgi:hypothetical protein
LGQLPLSLLLSQTYPNTDHMHTRGYLQYTYLQFFLGLTAYRFYMCEHRILKELDLYWYNFEPSDTNLNLHEAFRVLGLCSRILGIGLRLFTGSSPQG